MPKRSNTITAREFNQDVSAAKRAADKGPVIITNRGEPAYVLMSHKAYGKLSGAEPKKTLREMLAMPGVEDIEFDPPRIGNELPRIPKLD
jgi:prevent-host-death family protein